jgi:hypothetical protein
MERRISRRWLVFALFEAVILVPWLVLVIGYTTTDAVGSTTFAVAAIAVVVLDGALTLYWIRTRVRPLQDRQLALERVSEAEAR